MTSPSRTVLACVGADAWGEAVIRDAARLAQALGIRWIALYVETPDLGRLSIERREAVLATLRKAADLGAETYTLGSVDIARTILEFARTHGVQFIVVGKPSRRAWLRGIAGSMIETLITHCSEAAIHIVQSRVGTDPVLVGTTAILDSPDRRRTRWPRYALATALLAMASVIGLVLQPFLPSASIVMLYLLAAILAGLHLGHAPAGFTAIGGGLAFNFLFTGPRFTLHIHQLSDLVNFAGLLTVGLVVAHLSARARHQARVAVQREERAVSLGAFTGELLGAQTEQEIAAVACEHMGRAFDAQVELWVSAQQPELPPLQRLSNGTLEVDRDALLHTLCTGRASGVGTSSAHGSLHYMPIIGADRPIGVLAIKPSRLKRLILPEPRKALQSYAHQLALALERTHLRQQKESAELAMRAEDLRNDLLAGLSHDLRTPLAAILGSSSTLAGTHHTLSADSQRELIATIHEETMRMTRLVTNLLEMARLTRGLAKLNLEWFPVEELIGSVRHRLASLLEGRQVSVTMMPMLPLVYVDGLLFEQVLQNLVENAVKYSPNGAPIELSAMLETVNGAPRVTMAVSDRGAGVPDEAKHRIFDKFYRAHGESAQSGLGLGLALCRSIVLLHGGAIGVRDRVGGGSQFWVAVPLDEQQPRIEEAATAS